MKRMLKECVLKLLHFLIISIFLIGIKQFFMSQFTNFVMIVQEHTQKK